MSGVPGRSGTAGRTSGPDGDRLPSPGSPPALLAWQVLVLGFAAGLLASRWPLPGMTSLAVVAALDARSRRPVAFWGLLLVAALLGWGYAAHRLPADAAPPPQWLNVHAGYELTGVVESVEGKPGERWQVVLDEVRCAAPEGERALPGKVVWYWHDPTLRPVPGQRVGLRSNLMPVSGFDNPGAWDYGLYWRMQGVAFSAYCSGDKGVTFSPPPRDWSLRLRAALRDAVLDAAPEGQGRGLLLALLTGDRFELDPATVDVLRRAGLAHTLALSGLHLGFVAALGWALAWLLGRLWPSILLRLPRPKLAVLLAAPAVLGYVWLGQATPSLVRSGLMFGFWGVLLLRGRGRVLLDGLFLALACILIASPLSIFDIRLQLSAVAVAGIALLYPLLRPRLVREGLARVVLGRGLDLLLVSVCATLALLPITARTFGTLIPNLLPNLFWLPLLGFLVMPLGGAGMLLGAIPGLAPLGGPCVYAASGLLQWMLDVMRSADAAGAFPSLLVLRPLWPELLGCAVLLVSGTMYLRRPRGLSWGAVLLGVALLLGPHLAVLLADARDEVRLEAIDVGQGQSLLVRAPGGRRALIDGGGLRSRTLETGRDVVAPYLTLGRPPRLDLVVLSHPHMDHYKGLLHILRNFEVAAFAFNGRWPEGDYGKRLREALARAGLEPEVVSRGAELPLGPEVRFAVLMPPVGERPPSTNDGSLVLSLRRGGRNLALLPGDAEAWSLARLAELAGPEEGKRDLRSDVLVLPHHGSRTGLVPGFFMLVSPRVVFASCGRFGKADLPSPEVLAQPGLEGVPALDTAGSGLLRAVWSGRSGAVEFGAANGR